MIDSLPDYIFRLDRQGRLVNVESSGADSPVLPYEVSPGDRASDVLPPHIAADLMKHVEAAFESGQLQTFEYRLPVGAGMRYYENRLIAIDRDEVLSIVRDVTDKRTTEEMLQTLSRAIQQTADLVMITDVRGVIEYVNPAMTVVTGYSSAELVGQNPRVLKSGSHPSSYYEELWQTITSGSVYVDTLVNRRKDGELYYEEKTITPIRDSEGRITHFVSTGRDVTQRKRDEEKMVRMERLASIGQMAATVAHEIRNPLGSLELNHRYLIDRISRTPDIRNTIADMAVGFDRIQRIIKGILNFSQPIRSEKQRIDLHEVLKGALYSTAATCRDAHIVVDSHLVAEDHWIMGDRNQLHQVFVNLLENAIQAVRKEGRIKVFTLDTAEGLSVCVADSGPGIGPDIIGKIFDPFFTTRKDGTGLGLAIVSKILDAHDSVIRVESEGSDTKFTVLFRNA